MCYLVSTFRLCKSLILHMVFVWTPGDGGEKGDAFYILTEGQAGT